VLPELWRVKSEILARRADAPAGREAGALLRQALQRAQQQGFLSQQLRIATSQVRLIGASAKPELAAILAKFTEGLDTADLVAARAALAA